MWKNKKKKFPKSWHTTLGSSHLFCKRSVVKICMYYAFQIRIGLNSLLTSHVESQISNIHKTLILKNVWSFEKYNGDTVVK